MKQKDFIELMIQMMQAAGVTLRVFTLTLILSLVLGLMVALLRMNKLKIIQYPVRLYLLIMRGTPLILQLFFVFYGPPLIGLPGLQRFTAAIVAMTLNYAAYFAEIYRAGIESIPVGQYEASSVLGFSKRQTFFKIIMPQVIKRILPPMGNEFMTLVKDTALVMVIGVAEMYQVATDVMNSKATTIPLVMAGVFYLIFNSIVSKAVSLTEKKLSYYR